MKYTRTVEVQPLNFDPIECMTREFDIDDTRTISLPTDDMYGNVSNDLLISVYVTMDKLNDNVESVIGDSEDILDATAKSIVNEARNIIVADEDIIKFDVTQITVTQSDNSHSNIPDAKNDEFWEKARARAKR